MLILLAGFLYRPLPATAIAVMGGTLGALAAYQLVHHLSADYIRRKSETPFVKYLKKHAGFFELCALRTLPGFPHSMINYSAGLLAIKRVPFLFSTLVGFAVKGFVYTSAVYRTTHIEPDKDVMTFQNVWPLIALAVLMAAGSWGKKRFSAMTASNVDKSTY